MSRDSGNKLQNNMVSEEPSPDQKYHNNEVLFVVKSGAFSISSSTYTIDDFSITSGEDPDREIAKGQTRTWTGTGGGPFIFRVGRKKSSSVASFWRNNFEANESTFGNYPNELNFAFVGPLDFVVTVDGVRTTYRIAKCGLGQGQAFVTNNWWIAVGGAVSVGDNHIRCEAYAPETGGRLYFTFHRGGNRPVAANEIDITSISTSP